MLRKPNTDNKGKLFVTVFAFAPAPMTDLQCRYRDPASASYKTLYSLTSNLLSINFVPRHS